MNRLIAMVLIIPFTVLTVYAIYDVGLIGIFDYMRHSSAGWQVFADLVIACILCLVWLIPDARSKGRNPTPFIIITVFLGAFGPLLYLLTDKR